MMDIMVLCLFVGAFDFLRSNRWGLGEKFQSGFTAFGSIAINMLGIIALVPLIEGKLIPLIAPLFTFVGADPAMFAGMLLANDMGGFQLAESIAVSPDAAGFGGMLLGSMMGANIVFNIPVALQVISHEDRPAMAQGILCGFITLPLGCLAGGLLAGYPFFWMLVCLIPVLLVSGLIALLLWKIPKVIIRVFLVFGQLVGIVALAGTALSILAELTGLVILPGLDSVWTGLNIVCSIVIVLPGAYVMVELLSRLLRRPFRSAARLLGVNEISALGLLSTVASSIPTFSLIERMDRRGKVLNFAFLVSAGYAIGDHLAFCSVFAPDLVIPMVLGKLIGGVSALLLAVLITRRSEASA